MMKALCVPQRCDHQNYSASKRKVHWFWELKCVCVCISQQKRIKTSSSSFFGVCRCIKWYIWICIVISQPLYLYTMHIFHSFHSIKVRIWMDASNKNSNHLLTISSLLSSTSLSLVSSWCQCGLSITEPPTTNSSTFSCIHYERWQAIENRTRKRAESADQ